MSQTNDLLTPELRSAVEENVRAALAEDVGTGDLSAQLIDADETVTARVITREPGVWCGSPWVSEALAQVDAAATIRFEVEDGDVITADQTLFVVHGKARSLLTAERTMLNFAQLLSGTATLTATYVERIAHTATRLLDTRKTVPGLRQAQKYAVRCGGGNNHRMGLYDAYLLKENHISAAGSITAAVQEAQRLTPGKLIEVEVETLTQLHEAIVAGADTVMLDNFNLDETSEAVQLAQGQVKLEASGNVDLQTIAQIAETGVDYISVGALTKEVQPLDLSMRVVEE